MDRTATLVGAAVQTALTVFALYVAFPPQFLVGAPFLGGLLAGGLSGSFQREYVDGAAAAVLAAFGSLIGFAGLVWLGLGDAPLVLKVDTTFVVVVYGLAFLVVALPVAGIAGALAGASSARFRRRYRDPA